MIRLWERALLAMQPRTLNREQGSLPRDESEYQ